MNGKYCAVGLAGAARRSRRSGESGMLYCSWGGLKLDCLCSCTGYHFVLRNSVLVSVEAMTGRTAVRLYGCGGHVTV